MTGDRPVTGDRPGRTARRRAVLGALVLGAGALATAAATWVTASTESPVEAVVPLAVAGSVVAPGVPAGGLVVVAAGLALSLGGRWGRALASVGIVLGGVLVVASAVAALVDSASAARSAALEAVGVPVLVGPVGVTPAPWVAVAVGVLAVLLGLWSLVASRGWDRTSRYEQPGLPPGQQGTRPAPDDASRTAAPSPAGETVDDDHAAWDALTRGEDPT